MNDVARVAGVSLATVSRVVNGNGDVRADLVARVQNAVEMLGYRRDLTASTLRRADRQSASIGLVIEDVSNPFSSAVIRGVEDVARTHRVLTFVGSSDEEPERERELAEAFASRGVDGLIIVPCAADQSYLRRRPAARDRPVFVDRPPRFIDADAAVSDNAGGARRAVEHLLRAGHRAVAFLGDRPSIFTASERRRGYRETVADAGIACGPTRSSASAFRTANRRRRRRESCCSRPSRRRRCSPDRTSSPSAPSGRSAPSAVSTMSRSWASMTWCSADMIEPGITVVAQDPYELGRHAAELLFSQLGDRDGTHGGSSCRRSSSHGDRERSRRSNAGDVTRAGSPR